MIELNHKQKLECHAAADTAVNFLNALEDIKISHANMHAIHSGLRHVMYNLSANVIRYNVDPNTKPSDNDGST